MSIIKAQSFFQKQDFTGPVIILDRLQTPENIGSALRLAGNMNCKKVIFTDHFELHQTKIEKIARNSLKYIEIESMSYAQINDSYPELIAIETCDNAIDIYRSSLPLESVFIFGNERFGISEELLQICHKKVYIPMPGEVKSLNVSHAIAICIFEWYRQNFTSKL